MGRTVHIPNPRYMPARSDIGDDAPLRLIVAAVAGSMTAGGAAKGRPIVKRTTTLRAARIDATRIVLAKSRQFDRPLTTLWHTVGMHAHGKRLTREACLWRGRGASRPPYGKIKAAVPGGGEASGNQSGTAMRDSASRAASCKKARKFKNHGNIARPNNPGSRANAHRGVHFGHSIAGRARP
jgi:hypothetical protein